MVHLCSVSACELTLARLQYSGGGDWYADRSSLPNLIRMLHDSTRLAVCDTVATVTPDSRDLYHHPFIYMTGHGNIRFSENDVVHLRRYFSRGGFLWADDNFGMDESFRREIKKVFPNTALQPLSSDHPIFSVRFDLPGLPKIHEHNGEPAQLYALYHNDRIAVLYTFSADIGDGMENLRVHKVSPHLHAQALKMGTNIVTWFYEQ